MLLHMLLLVVISLISAGQVAQYTCLLHKSAAVQKCQGSTWPHAGMYQHICACKEVVAEPNNVSGEVFDEAIKGYR